MSVLILVFAVACVAEWVAVVGSRWGRLLAVPAVGITVALVTVVALTVTPFIGVSIGPAALTLLAACTALGVIVLVRRPRPLRRPSLAAIAVWIPSTLGAVVWIVSRLLSQFIPGAAWLSWSMEGDTTNNLLYARRIIADNGILLGGEENPVPFPVGVLALPMSLERFAVSETDLLRSDITVFGWVWTIVLAAGCIAMGAAVASCVPTTRPRLIAVASGFGSLLPLTWLISGLPIDFGFFNVPFAVPILMACWLLYLGAERSPAVAVAALIAASALLLLVWTPALMISAALGLVVVVREWRYFVRPPARTIVVILAPLAAFAVWFTTLTLPAFAIQSEAFEAGGMGYPSAWLLVAAIAAVGILVAAAFRTRTRLPVFAGVVAALLGSYAAAGVLLLVSRDKFDPWTAYYPVKFAWLATVVLLPIVLSQALGLLATIRRSAFSVPAVAAVGTLAVGLSAFAPLPLPLGYEARQPIARMLGGHVWNTGDEAVATILELSRRDELAILWRSKSPDESMINYWVIDALGGQLEGDPTLRQFSFSDYSDFRQFGAHRPGGTNDLCDVLREPTYTVIVYTDDLQLEGSLPDWCAGGSARFRVGETPGVDY